MKDKITFKDLSIPLKTAVVTVWIYLLILVITITTVFVETLLTI